MVARRWPRRLRPARAATTDENSKERSTRGPDGVPSEGALRQAWCARPPSARSCTTAEEARAAAEQIGGVTVIKAQVKAGGRGKAGGVKLAKTPDEAQEHADGILALTIKDLPVNRVLVAPADPAGGGVLLLLPAGPLQPLLPVHRLGRGRRGDRGGRQDQPRRGEEDRDRRRAPASTRRRPREIVEEVGFPGRAARPGGHHGAAAVDGLRRGGRHAGRGQPAGAARGRRARGAGRQGLPRRERRVPPRGPRGSSRTRARPTRSRPRPRPRGSTTSSSTARSASSATAPGW